MPSRCAKIERGSPPRQAESVMPGLLTHESHELRSKARQMIVGKHLVLSSSPSRHRLPVRYRWNPRHRVRLGLGGPRAPDPKNCCPVPTVLSAVVRDVPPWALPVGLKRVVPARLGRRDRCRLMELSNHVERWDEVACLCRLAWISETPVICCSR